jgi:hypothetical protein
MFRALSEMEMRTISSKHPLICNSRAPCDLKGKQLAYEVATSKGSFGYSRHLCT